MAKNRHRAGIQEPAEGGSAAPFPTCPPVSSMG
jgi:hypothetical protein